MKNESRKNARRSIDEALGQLEQERSDWPYWLEDIYQAPDPADGSEAVERMLAAIRSGDFNGLQEAMRAAPRSALDETGSRGDCPASAAIWQGDIRMLRELLLAGASPDARNYEGEHLLICCSDLNKDEQQDICAACIRLLVESGASIEMAEPFQERTAAHWACARLNLAAVQELERLGADLLRSDIKGQSPIQLAFKHHARDKRWMRPASTPKSWIHIDAVNSSSPKLD